MAYDGAGREASRVASTPAGVLSLSFGDFDAAGRPCAVDAGSAGSKTRVFDQAGRLSSESGYGYAAGLPVPGAELSYNANTGRLEAEAYRFAFAGRTDSVRSYAYTADGRLAFASISGMPDVSYAYEPGTGNLVGIKRGSEPTTTLAYEQGSGRIAALISQGATQTVFAFDSRGRRASQGTPASPQTVRFAYDDADRLVGCSDASRGVSASYAYDAYGQRVRSVVASGSLVATTAYAYDGLSLLCATTARSDGATESVTYLYDAAGAPFAGIYEGSAAASPVAFFLATAARGDAAELLDSSGAPFALYSYDACGSPGAVLTAATARIPAALAQAIADANVLRYAGYAYDAHSGLYCLSKRYYDPATAQFLTKDPAKADGEESPYQYCGGYPVGKVDPSGCETVSCHEVRREAACTEWFRASAVIGDSLETQRFGCSMRTIWTLSRMTGALKLVVTVLKMYGNDPWWAVGGRATPSKVELWIRKPSGSVYRTSIRATNSTARVPSDGGTYIVARRLPEFRSNEYRRYWIVKMRMWYVVSIRTVEGTGFGSAAGTVHYNPIGLRRP